MQVVLDHAGSRIITGHRPDVAAICHGSSAFDNRGSKYLSIPYDIANSKLLTNFGAKVPSPILTQYDWAGDTPWDSQRETAALLTMSPRAFVLSTMGVGKTRAALYAFDYLRSVGAARRLLVIAPLSCLVPVWEEEMFRFFHHMKVAIVHGSKHKRMQALAQDADVYVINHDGIKVVGDQLVGMCDTVVLDELAAFRNAQTDRWKAAKQIVAPAERAWGMTGSPTPNAPTDAYGQIKLLTPERVPRSFKRFQSDLMYQVSNFRWIAKTDATDKVYRAMQPSVRYTMDQVHDIPPTTFSYRHIEPTAAQKAMYMQLKNHMTAMHKGQQITAVNEGALMSKLLQIAAGFAYSKEKGYYVDAKPRIKEIINIIEQAGKKVIVFTNFKWCVRALEQVIGSKYTVGAISGDTPKKERDKIITLFRQSPDPHVIVAHPGTMAHGLTLVEADTIIWHGPTQNPEYFEQANARIPRPGQDSHTHIIMLYSLPVELKAFKRLQNKQNTQGLLLDMFEGVEYES